MLKIEPYRERIGKVSLLADRPRFSRRFEALLLCVGGIISVV
jgi:hypothetical protein